MEAANKTIKECLVRAKEILEASGIENAYNDAKLLMMHVAGYDFTGLIMNMDSLLEKDKEELYFKYIDKRAENYPLQYITGVQEFMGYEFLVNPDVLIPRQDTELLVETALLRAEKRNLSVLDMCTGSGCIGISFRKKRLEEGFEDTVLLTDISEKALDIAEKNNEKLSAGCKTIKSDMFCGLQDKKFDMILSNPPYIETEVIEGLMKEVREFEPYTALCGHEDGLYFYRIMAKEAKKYLNEKGKLFLETGYNQFSSVSGLLYEGGFKNIELFKDYNNLDRLVYAEI